MEMDNSWLKDPEVFKVNRLSATSSHHYYKTHSEKEQNKSSFIHSLNGYWKFHYANGLNDKTDNFYEEDYDCSNWNEIEVPSHIQLQGYGSPMYTNQIYPWSGREELLPGELPIRNPIGQYVTYFDSSILNEDTDTRIVFHGVESALALWMNGSFVGYSQDSFTPSVFDITHYLKKGRNKIAVNVYRFSSGSWLEDQDFWRFSGIFRDVELHSIPRVHVNDLKITTECSNLKSVFINVQIEILTLLNDYKLKFKLFDSNNLLIHEYMTNEPHHIFSIENPLLWSAEKPNLYHLEIEVLDDESQLVEVIYENVGIRQFKLHKGIMYLNGKRIVFHGVNRHEFCCETGRVVSYEMTKQDILNMKENNINAIRTSHYPNQTFFYELCDELGMYVIDEVNLETHGTWSEGFDKDHIIPDDKPEWQMDILDRAKSMYERDKNHPCILMWSCGNESYGGKNIYEVSEYFRNEDNSRLVHYEGISHDPRYPDTSDVVSEMYTPAKDVEEYLKTHNEKPFILCEYSHSMGNSNGALYKYIDLEKKYPHYQGGFIWDYVDQALLRDGKLCYGGDFRERPSDYDFCGNGIVFADRKNTPKMQEVKYCYQNIDIAFSNNIIKFTNHYLFTDLNEFKVKVIYQKNGENIKEQEYVIDCKPLETTDIMNPYSFTSNSKEEIESVLVVVEKNGNEVAHEQYVYSYEYKEKYSSGKVIITEDYLNIGIHAEGFNAIFSKQKGLVSYKVHDKEFIRLPLRPNFFRAATNNDVENKYGFRYGEWLLASLYAKCKYLSYENKDEYCLISYEYELPNISVPLKMEYEVHSDGKIIIDMSLTSLDGHIEMPEFGFLMQTYPELDSVNYLGMGPSENYIDRKQGAIIANYDYKVKDNLTPYLYPQECGNRCDVIHTKIYDQNHHALIIQGSKYECSVLPYTPFELENAKHIWELPNSYQTVISINEKQMGIAGDNTWGAKTHDEFLLSRDTHHLRVAIIGE